MDTVALPEQFKWLIVANAIPVGAFVLALLASALFGPSVWGFHGFGPGSILSLLALAMGTILNLIYVPQAVLCLVRNPGLRSSVLAVGTTVFSALYLCVLAITVGFMVALNER